MRIALTRDVSPAMDRCELSHLARNPIDHARAVTQHAMYEQCLMELGCRVQRIPADASMPDAVFIEDTAVVVDELAVITRPGARSRRPETEAVSAALAPYRSRAIIEAPGTLDGGDVLRIGRTFFVGDSARSNRDGIAQLGELLAPLDYRVVPVTTRDCLHLKTAATVAAPGIVVLNPDWVDRAVFGAVAVVEVDPAEPFAGNVLRVGEATISAAAFPRTIRRLEELGIDVRALDMSEFAKAEGGVTCCSVVFEHDEEGRQP
jgi:dimethylargininase